MGSDERSDAEPGRIQTSGLISRIPEIHPGDTVIDACFRLSSSSGLLVTQRRESYAGVRLS